MSQERATPAQWDVLTAELRSYREQQKQTWGELDNALIGRYLAGEVTDDERRTVETALKDHPELRKLTDLVLDVLNEFQPSSLETPAPLPRLLPFTDRRQTRRPFLSRIRERGALVAAACVLLALGVTLLKVPGSNPVTHVAHHRGPEVAQRSHPLDLLADDEFPIRTRAVSSIKAVGASDAAEPPPPVEDIAKVAAWTERRLGTPLAAPRSPPQRSGLGMAPAGGRVEGEVKKSAPLQTHALYLKDSFARKEKRNSPRGLEQAAPYLARGVCQEAKPALQDRCGKALVRMAPFAGEAVPFLKKALEQSANPKQQKIIVEVLKNLGPAANDAAPQLAKLAEHGTTALRAEAKEALRCVCVGVNDQGQVFSAEACRRLNERAARLSRQHQVFFSAQTYRQRPAGRVWNYAKQVQAANGRSLSVLICADSQAVEVTLSPDLNGKDALLNAASLRKMIQDTLRKKTPEQGLEQAVELMERTLSHR